MTENRPAPEFHIGERVEVVSNERNKTPHIGTVRDVIWHFKDHRYNFYLDENGKKLSKRYIAEDLKRADKDSCDCA